ncbi:flagellar hook-basal body protein [Leptospira kirschneri str. 200803703]|uniref:Flagellar hook protein FlgE n=2 Tax=Leptospira kirschneri TaxID=29507 RepID=A0A828Y718_9LEPT|nr:flagellar hook-basal body protein [Leptospira kirschneri serovar Grippotyphosa str. RM52]EKO53603.1 flagellar hook-basal body protein [Leptospira kirschneri str. 200802841]EKQ83653.1 flagellar hook-basal body protein [Leptospira kirschneri serovar Grippotyphosa str. Moskva]EKR08439.1 flagellar hook-basal body protein [Leptospira kirschneri serovar Valbuzzi str. 200702274]EMK05490.1 flagellar hook-basal body protein [Leptospira kirschneri str. MMD1493]EMN26285.1 flagellar hook-basal body pro
MDVIGNNISNVNTHGFKTERVTFQDMISQELRGASEPKENIGGVNPQQVGLGSLIAAIDKIMTQGSLQTTGKNTDVAVSGEGFFIVKDGDKQFYTRAGAFNLDKNGYYVNPANGLKVQGWNSRLDDKGNKYINSAASIEDIIIPVYSKEPARATSQIDFKSNLNSSAPTVPPDATQEEITAMINDPDPKMRRGHVTTINTFDDQGIQREFKMEFYKVRDNTWKARLSMTDSTQLSVDVSGTGGQNTQLPGNVELEFGFTPDGKLVYVSDGVDSMNSGKLNAKVSFRIPGNPAIQNFDLNLGEAGMVNGITQFSSDFTTKAVKQDGYTMGYLESFSIDNSGTITGVFSNGVRQPLARIATAVFNNPAGLDKAGDTMFAYSMNSGEPNIGEAGVQGRGKINAGLLEMSNVDLSDQFTDMIVTQRGFQANSRTITTSDQMIQEVLGLKR